MTGTQSAATKVTLALVALSVLFLAAGCAELNRRLPASGFDDTVLEGRVKELYWTDSVLANTDILVIAKSGAITLSGTVATEEMRSRAETVARKVTGVKSVVNRIEVPQ